MLSMVSVNASGLGMNSPEIQFSNALCNRSGPTPRIRSSGEALATVNLQRRLSFYAKCDDPYRDGGQLQK
jgi:hypothetical protein